MTLVKTASGFELNIDRAVEPRTTLTLVNVRTKTKSSVAVGDETSAKIALPKGTLEDDDLVILVQGDDQRPHTHKDAHLTSRICRVGDDALVDMSYDDYRNACFFYNQFNDALSLPAL